MEDITAAFFSFDDFHALNEDYGRNFGDNFLITVSDSIKEKYSDMFDIYHTDVNEFCFILKKFADHTEADRQISQIAQTLSSPVEVSKLTVQRHVSGCIYHYHASERLDVNALLVKVDRAMKEAKQNTQHSILEVNSLYSQNLR